MVRTWSITLSLLLTIYGNKIRIPCSSKVCVCGWGWGGWESSSILHFAPCNYGISFFLYKVRLTERLSLVAHWPNTPCHWNLPVPITHDLLTYKINGDFEMLTLLDVSVSSNDAVGKSLFFELFLPQILWCHILLLSSISPLFMDFTSTHPWILVFPRFLSSYVFTLPHSGFSLPSF